MRFMKVVLIRLHLIENQPKIQEQRLRTVK